MIVSTLTSTEVWWPIIVSSFNKTILFRLPTVSRSNTFCILHGIYWPLHKNASPHIAWMPPIKFLFFSVCSWYMVDQQWLSRSCVLFSWGLKWSCRTLFSIPQIMFWPLKSTGAACRAWRWFFDLDSECNMKYFGRQMSLPGMWCTPPIWRNADSISVFYRDVIFRLIWDMVMHTTYLTKCWFHFCLL